MTVALDDAIERIKVRAEDDPDFAETILWLASEDRDDPFESTGQAVLDRARDINRRNQSAHFDQMLADSITTAEVVELLTSVSDRKGVDRRRRRARLLGVRVGRETFHPLWQFDLTRRDTWAGVPEVLAALSTVTSDPLTVHTIATAPNAIGDRSIADLLATGEVELAVRAAYLAGDQS